MTQFFNFEITRILSKTKVKFRSLWFQEIIVKILIKKITGYLKNEI